MDTPRILAIDDVHLTAPCGAEAELAAFYSELIGLAQLERPPDLEALVFRGYPRSGPRLVLDLSGGSRAQAVTLRRQVQIQVGSLAECTEALAERRVPFTSSHGWYFYDRRVVAFDPSGNRVELVAYHEL